MVVEKYLFPKATEKGQYLQSIWLKIKIAAEDDAGPLIWKCKQCI